MEYFPEDVLMPIFSKLRGKSLIRFKCLSKRWNLVFSGRIFNRMFISLQNHQDFILQYDGLCPKLSRLRIGTSFNGCGESLRAKDIECPLQEASDEILRIAHCDGILCMFITNIKEDDGTQSAVVWNPMTKEHKRFKLTGFGSWEAFGFGYDSVIDDYKVIHIKGSRAGFELQWRNIHSIRLKKAGIEDWVAALNNVPYSFSISANRKLAIAVNGCLYWIATKQDDFGKVCHVILCFDLGREILQEETSLCGEGIFYEVGKRTIPVSGFLGLLGNSLCLARMYDFAYTDLFVMEENEVTKAKYWIKLMRFMRDGIEKEIRHLGGYPILVPRNGQILTNEFSETGLFLFSQDESVKKIAIRGLRRIPYKWLHVIPYVESLLSPIA
ncbi:hypothetical protein SLE2022_032460 [Rubroshorea leprosula]